MGNGIRSRTETALPHLVDYVSSNLVKVSGYLACVKSRIPSGWNMVQFFPVLRMVRFLMVFLAKLESYGYNIYSCGNSRPETTISSSSRTFRNAMRGDRSAKKRHFRSSQGTKPMNSHFYEDDPLYFAFYLAFAVLNLILGTVIIYVGVEYKERCKSPAPTFLIVAGSVALASSVAKVFQVVSVFACRRFLEANDFACIILRPLVGFALEMGVLIWGTVVLAPMWPAYVKETTTKRAGQHDYCGEAPFLLGFVLMIVNWTMLPLQCCCVCWVLVGLLFKTASICSGKMHLQNARAL